MKKIIVSLLLFFVVSKIAAQDNELITEEKSSNWVRIGTPPVTAVKKQQVKKQVTATRKTTPRKTVPVKKSETPPAPKDDEFNKTNSKVKRFQKD